MLNYGMSKQWIKDRLRDCGKQNKDLAKALRLENRPAAITEIIKGTRDIKLSEVGPMAKVLDWPIEDLSERLGIDLTGSTEHGQGVVRRQPEPNDLTRFPVIGTVEAGAWRDRLEYDANDLQYIEILPDSRYPSVPKFALDVVGESMNKRIPHGSQILCVNLFDLSPDLSSPNYLNGRYVVVKKRNAMDLSERTIKKYVLSEEQVELWPESDHPDFQKPLRLEDNGEEDNAIIEALVIKILQDV